MGLSTKNWVLMKTQKGVHLILILCILFRMYTPADVQLPRAITSRYWFDDVLCCCAACSTTQFTSVHNWLIFNALSLSHPSLYPLPPHHSTLRQLTGLHRDAWRRVFKYQAALSQPAKQLDRNVFYTYRNVTDTLRDRSLLIYRYHFNTNIVTFAMSNLYSCCYCFSLELLNKQANSKDFSVDTGLKASI